MGLFDRVFGVSEADTEILMRDDWEIAWDSFLLNPRRLRGSDFLMRWSQGVWSERRIAEAVNDTGTYAALPYGPSGVAPSDDVRAHECTSSDLRQLGWGTSNGPTF